MNPDVEIECAGCGIELDRGDPGPQCEACVAADAVPVPTGLDAVIAWSLRIHGPDRHAWCVAAAEAELDGGPVPPWPGGRASTGADRLVTIRRILEVS